MFGIREYFQKLAADRAAVQELKEKFEAIRAAIDSGDEKKVREMAAHTVFSYRQETALVLNAINTDNVGIFDAVLKGANLKNDPNYVVHFHSPLMLEGPHHYSESSLLYLAIGNGRTNVAVALATNPETDITKSGYSETSVYHSGGLMSSGHMEHRSEKYRSPLELAHEMGMPEVIAPLALRTAELKQQEAAALLQEARAPAP